MTKYVYIMSIETYCDRVKLNCEKLRFEISSDLRSMIKIVNLNDLNFIICDDMRKITNRDVEFNSILNIRICESTIFDVLFQIDC